MPVADQLQRLIDRAVAKRAVRGVLAAIRSGNGEVDAAAVAGSADAALTVPLTIATPYHLASITKMYTAVVVMQLVRERTLDLPACGASSVASCCPTRSWPTGPVAGTGSSSRCSTAAA